MKKKIICLLTGAMICLSACGGSNVEGETVPETTEESTTQTEIEETTPEVTEDVTDNTEEAVNSADAETEKSDLADVGSSDSTDAASEVTAETTTDSTPVDSAEEELDDSDLSPMFLWDYEGYVDEAKGYYWRSEFVQTDYDGDGKVDKLLRKYNADKQEAYYTLEFGNGRKLEVPTAYDTGFPHIKAADLNGDGEREILFTLTYDTSTDPMAFGDMWLFEYSVDESAYKEVKLPLTYGENGAKGLKVDYDAPTDEGIHFTVLQNDYEATIPADAEYVQNWWTTEAVEEERDVFYTEISEGDSPAIYCEVEALPRFGTVITFELVHQNGEYVIENMEYKDTSRYEW